LLVLIEATKIIKTPLQIRLLAPHVSRSNRLLQWAELGEHAVGGDRREIRLISVLVIRHESVSK
jgi:hypothetical protein